MTTAPETPETVKVADLVKLSRMLLGCDTELTVQERILYDMNSDGRHDTFDLALMRKSLCE